MKRFFLSVLSLLLLLSTSACAAKSYADDKTTAAIADEALVNLRDGVIYRAADESYLEDYFTSPDYASDAAIRHAMDANNLNELGVYHVPAEKVGEMKALLEGYLKDALQKNQSWYDSYIPQETPKLRDAEVKVFGNYVAYAIFDSRNRRAVFNSLEKSLTK
ncbi:MAG: DUF4358 domain-containing protein [Clostridia bacterium]|nr:DUF4358 domain-containing protein [Clostridia bacterium]